MSPHLIVLILHMLGAGLIIGVALLAVFAFWRPPATEKALGHLMYVARYGMFASVWQLVTGLGLASMEWSEFRSNRLFWTKITLYVLEGAVATRLIAAQAKKTSQALASGQPATGDGLRRVLWLQALIIVGIAILGVTLVSGGEE